MSEDDEQYDETDLASADDSDDVASEEHSSAGTDHSDETNQSADVATEDTDLEADAAEPADATSESPDLGDDFVGGEDGGEQVVDESAETEVEASTEAASETKFCTDCGASISRDAEICPECGVRQQTSSVSSSDGEKESGVSAVLSFLLPGVGQLYNGQVSRGAVVFIGWMIWEFVAFVITTLTLGIFFLIWVPVELFIHVVAAYDAYDQAEKINAGNVVVD